MSFISLIGGPPRAAAGGQAGDRRWQPAPGWLVNQLRVAAGLAGLGVACWVNLRMTHPGPGAEQFAALIVAGMAWVAWLAAPHSRVAMAALAVLGAAGGVASTVTPGGLIFVGVVAAGAGARWELFRAAGIAAAGPFGFTCAALAVGMFPGRLAPACAVCLIGLVSGAGRRQMAERVRQATLIALADERAEVATREAALAAERNQLGRELHDVLAHTLGALSVQLCALDALATTDATPDELRGQIERIHTLVDEGLDEAHQAVRALRGHPQPIADELARLCDQHGAAFTVSGTPRPVSAEAHLALYRVAQESLTNAARHAPGSPVTVEASFGSGAATLTVRNPVCDPPAETKNGGYGLSGMRERVLLAGGHCHAGSTDQGWQVTASIPV